MSLRLRLLNAGLRALARPRLARLTDPAVARRDLSMTARLFLARPKGVTVDRVAADGPVPPHLLLTPPGAGPGILVYFHGGGYIAGSPETHIGLLAALARAAGVCVIAPQYRLAPEHPFPAAPEDAFALWSHLRQSGHRPEEIALGGDSAGGGLALLLLARLCAQATPPAAVLTFSPWTDLSGSGDSCRDNARRDPILPVGRLGELAGFALGELAADDPRVSPLFADYPGCPPLFFAVSGSEILRDDTLRLARRLAAEGAWVEVDIHPDCPHAWPMFAGRLPEADATVRRAGAFLRQVFNQPAEGSAGS
ncbi:MAG: alpha/beta hydrolase [Paracoccaceae bacterium]